MTQDIQPTRYCLGCSYILDGLPENRCPECGHPFDPDDPSSFRKTPREAPSPLRTALLCGGPFVLIGMLIVVELGYVSTPGYPATSPTLPQFLRWTLRAELLVLLLALASVPFIHSHLSTFSGYTRLKPLPKAATALVIGCVYLAAVAGVLIFVASLQPRTLGRPLQNRQLLAEGQVLDGQDRPAYHHGPKEEEKHAEEAHARSLQNPWGRGNVPQEPRMGKTISRVWTTGTEFSGGTAPVTLRPDTCRRTRPHPASRP